MNLRMSRNTEITEQSRMPLKLVLSIMLATVMVVGMFYRIDNRLSNIEKHIPTDWTTADQELWALRLQNQNPELKVPDIHLGTRTSSQPTPENKTTTLTCHSEQLVQ